MLPLTGIHPHHGKLIEVDSRIVVDIDIRNKQGIPFLEVSL